MRRPQHLHTPEQLICVTFGSSALSQSQSGFAQNGHFETGPNPTKLRILRQKSPEEEKTQVTARQHDGSSPLVTCRTMEIPEQTGRETGAPAVPLARKTPGDKDIVGDNHGRRSSSTKKSKQRPSVPGGTRKKSLSNASLPPVACSTTPDPRKNRKRKASTDKEASSAEDRASISPADGMEEDCRKKAAKKPRRLKKTQDEGPVPNRGAEKKPVTFFEDFEDWCNQNEYAMCFTVAKTSIEPGRSTESTGENVFIADGYILTGIAVCWDEREAHYFPLDNVDPEKLKKQFGTKKSVIVPDVLRALSFLARPCSLNPADCGWQEPKLANWLLDPEKWKEAIPDLVKQWIPASSNFLDGLQSTSQPDRSEEPPNSRNKRRGQVRVDAWQENVVSGEVARTQVVQVWKLHKALVKELKEKQMYDLYTDHVVPVLGLHCKMILNGLGYVSKEVLRAVSSAMEDLKNDIDSWAEEKYDLNKPTQVKTLIKTKLTPLQLDCFPLRNVSTDASLTKISEELRLRQLPDYASKIRDWRKMNRIKNTLESINKKCFGKLECEQDSGEIRHLICSLGQTLTATGRISLSRPNLQFVQKNTEVCTEPVITIKARAALKPSPGAVFLSADYSQLELRILADLSKDTKLQEVFTKGGDVFRIMAARWNKCREEDIDDTKRSHTKQICYGILYGRGFKSIADELGISEEEAKDMMKKFEEAFPGVNKYRRSLLEEARESKRCVVATLLGRRRCLRNLTSTDKKEKREAERQALNTVVQGSAADVFWTALLAIDKALKQELLRSGQEKEGGTYMVLQVYDEVMLEVREDDVDKVSKVVRDSMEGVQEQMKLSVPFPVRMRKGNTWGDMEDI